MADVLITITTPTNTGTLPRFAYRNHLAEAATLDAPEGQPGYPIEQLLDWRIHTRYKPSALPATITTTYTTARPITSWCCYGHDLGHKRCSIGMEYSQDGGLTWHPYGPVHAPAGSEIIYQVGELVQANAIRFTIVGLRPPEIGMLVTGDDLVMPVGLQPGFTPPRCAQQPKTIARVSRQGVPLGVDVEYSTAAIVCQFQGVDEYWVLNRWLPFRTTCQHQPFFFHPFPEIDPHGAAYCSGAEFDGCAYSTVGFQSVGVKFRGDV